MTDNSSHYLRSLHIDAFGALAQRDIGPFLPHMNLVFGQNEAGKTTVNSFIEGVLFGWQDARGQRNTYKPANAERSGTLVFAPVAGEGDEIRCTRVRSADGIKPDPEPAVLSDIDEETFGTVFALDSDELRGLGKTTDVTARLLTAGAGTACSPSSVLADIDARLAARTSRAAANVDSIVNLQAALDETRAELAQATAEAEQFKRENREFLDLQPRRAELMDALAALNRDIETLSVQRDALAKLNDAREGLREQEENLHQEENELRALAKSKQDARGKRYLQLDAVEERTVREGIEDFSEDRSRLEHIVTMSKQDAAVSRAAYEALEEADDIQEMRRQVKRQRLIQIVISIVLPLAFIGLGVPAFIHGREITSLSITMMGIMLIVCAVFFAAAALVLLFRPNKTEEEMQKRLQDAQWVMLQDEKKLSSCENELADQARRIEAYLADAGLDEAQGSLRRARAMLDEAREARADDNLMDQRRQALIAQRAALDEAKAANERDRTSALAAIGEGEDVPIAVLDARLAQRKEQRDAQLHTAESINARYGELKQELASARHMKRFDQLKLEYQLLQTRMGEAMEDYARLLLAKRMLKASMAAWESKSQPRVYQQASRLLELMTNGRWTRVRIGPDGNLEVVDAFDTVRSPLMLSLGTCQQLYLSLRVALLMTAGNVGRSIPILADDILVNFDADRRRGAAAALRELSEQRQVIMFTCHEEVVRLMQDACSDMNLVRL